MSIEGFKAAIYRCHHCRACSLTDSDEIGWHRVCPTYEAYPFEHYAAGGRIAIARAWLEGFIEDPEGIVEAVFTCLGCGACQEICQAFTEVPFPIPDGIDTPGIMRALREELVGRGLAPKIIQSLDQGVTKNGNAFGGTQAAKKKFADTFSLPAKGETLFFAGCYSFFGGLSQILESSMKIFTSIKERVAFLADKEQCCGILQYANGNTKLCTELVQHNLAAIKASGAKRVVTTCAGCYHAMDSVYPEIVGDELPFEVLHTSQYLASLIEEKKIDFTHELDITLTYHDPCHLGRLSKVFEEPRKVIMNLPGIRLLEMEQSREQAWCCGGGEGIVSLAFPKLAATIGQERIKQVQQTGATTIITTCPHCNTVLNRAAHNSDAKIVCRDLSDIVAEAMRP